MGDVRISDEAAVLYIDIRTRSQHFRESGQTLMGIFWGLQIIVRREMRNAVPIDAACCTSKLMSSRGNDGC